MKNSTENKSKKIKDLKNYSLKTLNVIKGGRNDDGGLLKSKQGDRPG